MSSASAAFMVLSHASIKDVPTCFYDFD